MTKNFLIQKDSKTGEITYLEYDKLNGYRVKPRIKTDESIAVSQIIFIEPSFSEKIIKKKIELQIKKLTELMRYYDTNEGGDDDSGVRRSLVEAEKLKLKIINDYVHYLGNTYASISIQKVQLIIDSLRTQLINMNREKQFINTMNNYRLANMPCELETDESRGRKGR